jgi:glycerophosphoryl diester phosphodiesterase
VVAELLRSTDREPDVVISGCPARWVRAVRIACPGATVLLNLHRGQRLVARLGWRWLLRRWLVRQARRAEVGVVNVAHCWVDRRLVEALAEDGRAVWAFTVDDPARAAELAGMGVAAVTTNQPARMVAAFAGADRSDGGAPATP